MAERFELAVRCSFQARIAIVDHEGICRHPHGYRFELTVTIAGEPNAEHPWLMDIVAIERILDFSIVQKLDRQDLNTIIAYPSLEGILLYCINTLRDELPNISRLDLEAPPRYRVSWQPDFKTMT